MEHGWLIYSMKDAEKNMRFVQWFMEEAKLQYISLELVLREEIAIGITGNERTITNRYQNVTKPDFAIVRTIEPLLSVHLESCGITVFNPSSVAMICNDKALTHHTMNDLGIPMMDTFFLQKNNLSETAPLSFPFVVKESGGRGGEQVHFIQNQNDWVRCTTCLATSNIIAQSSNVQLGKDLRVFVVGEEIIGAVLRENKNDFRANYMLGGSAQLYKLGPLERSLVHKIISHFNFGMVGIDFLIGLDGDLIFNEIEDVVGSRTLSKVSDINIVRKYISYIKDDLRKRNFRC
ncbi:ATP-grasp domain-containing protein [Virgibacillus ainsalahensis]